MRTCFALINGIVWANLVASGCAEEFPKNEASRSVEATANLAVPKVNVHPIQFDCANALQTAVFSFDGRLIAAADSQFNIHVWEVDERKRIAHLTGHTEVIRSLAFSQDAKALASAANDGTVRIWSLGQAGADHIVMNEASTDFSAVSFVPHQKKIAIGSGTPDGRIWLIELDTGAVRMAFSSSSNDYVPRRTRGWIGKICASRDGSVLAADAAGILVLINARENNVDEVVLSAGVDSISPDAKLIAWVGAGVFIAPIDDLASPTILRNELKSIFDESDGDLDSLGFVDADRLAVAFHSYPKSKKSNRVGIWDTKARKWVCCFNAGDDSLRGFCSSPSRKSVATYGTDGKIRVWDLKQFIKEEN